MRRYVRITLFVLYIFLGVLGSTKYNFPFLIYSPTQIKNHLFGLTYDEANERIVLLDPGDLSKDQVSEFIEKLGLIGTSLFYCMDCSLINSDATEYVFNCDESGNNLDQSAIVMNPDKSVRYFNVNKNSYELKITQAISPLSLENLLQRKSKIELINYNYNFSNWDLSLLLEDYHIENLTGLDYLNDKIFIIGPTNFPSFPSIPFDEGGLISQQAYDFDDDPKQGDMYQNQISAFVIATILNESYIDLPNLFLQILSYLIPSLIFLGLSMLLSKLHLVYYLILSTLMLMVFGFGVSYFMLITFEEKMIFFDLSQSHWILIGITVLTYLWRLKTAPNK